MAAAGAGANLLRSTAYFNGNGAAGHLSVLIIWTVLGLAAIFAGPALPAPVPRRLGPEPPEPHPHHRPDTTRQRRPRRRPGRDRPAAATRPRKEARMSATDVTADQRGVAVLEDPLANKGTAFDAGERTHWASTGCFRRRWSRSSSRDFVPTRRSSATAMTFPGTSTCGPSRTPTKCSSTGWSLSISRRCSRSCTRQPWGSPASDSATSTAATVACSFRTRSVTAWREVLRNRPRHEVDVIVVTDGERILGLGDQGAGGLGIPIGKLSLYTAIGGIPPARTLPVVLDVGTDNPQLLNDPEYIGWRHERVDGDAYFEFVERFVEAVERELPGTLLQWEDFASAHARPILDRYRDRLLTFNDDIQGTAAVVAGALTGAVQVERWRLRDQRVAILGAGSAGIGVADMLRRQMVTAGASGRRRPPALLHRRQDRPTHR